MFRSVPSALISLALIVLTTTAASAQDVSGVWLSPDWLFPGTRQYTEREVRQTARRVLTGLSEDGVTEVFLETFLRGYGICPSIEMAPNGQVLRIMDYMPGTSTHPVYPHLNWNYTTTSTSVLDPLQIFIEEAQLVGIEIHAWVHLFYWRMDNTDVMLGWHNGPTMWSELMVDYLDGQADKLELLVGESVRPGYEEVVAGQRGDVITPEVLRQASQIFAQGCDDRALERLLEEAGFKPERHPIGSLIKEILAAGGERPDFLLTAGDDDPFPAPRGRHLRSIYVDPAHPQVRQRLLTAFANIAKTHPGLAGVHLDHVRYPVDGQGLSPETGVTSGTYRYYSAADPQQMEEYRELHRALARRRELLHTFVAQVREAIPRQMDLSAAVLPLYYRDRDTGNKFRTSGYDYASQDWMSWPVDYVVPMMYEYHPYLIRTLVQDYRNLARGRNPERPIRVYPGISRLNYTKNGGVDARGWVFFDLTLARDVNAVPNETEDLDFGGE